MTTTACILSAGLILLLLELPGILAFPGKEARLHDFLAPQLPPSQDDDYREAALPQYGSAIDNCFADSCFGPMDESRHPMWNFEGARLSETELYICGIVLFFAGVLCSAGGIGGGGIYVTVLMVFGRLDVKDAVPLSKFIVFFGAMISLVMNLHKMFDKATKKESDVLIDYNICRLVVPSALLGTYLGVFFNRHIPSWGIVAILSSILAAITLQVSFETFKQFREEQSLQTPTGESPIDVPEPESEPGEVDPNAGHDIIVAEHSIVGKCESTEPPRMCLDAQRNLGARDTVVLISMLIIVIVLGVFRFHAGQCREALARADASLHACHHPSLIWLGYDTLQALMDDAWRADALRSLSLISAVVICLTLALVYSTELSKSGWSCCNIAKYCSMSIITGCLAGLVGIGGGLIFSPFFLIMGLPPATAVATSSTCVIFTSASTSFQYLFTDRIIMSLAIVYGLVNLSASYLGTSIVHVLQDRFSARKSYISAIVAAGVLISTILSLMKLAANIGTQMHHAVAEFTQGGEAPGR